MRTIPPSGKLRPSSLESQNRESRDLLRQWSDRVVGQAPALRQMVPYVEMYQAGLGPEGRPAGVFLLLGPTGTGKTRTVEALAEVLHGSQRNILRVDCGEFQMEHEVAKLIGAPPGYLGHRETQPMLTQQKLGAISSESCGLSLVLFDEIEKAAPSMTRLLLGVLDKAALRLGDNSTVNFERTLIFMTSNLGAAAMRRALHPEFGFETMAPPKRGNVARKLEHIGANAARRKFSPEFLNRVDATITYQPLDAASLAAIVDQQIQSLERHIEDRLAERAFELMVEKSAREFILSKGTSDEYGARELKRTILRHITQPLASMVAGGLVAPDALVRVKAEGGNLSLTVED